MSLSDAAEASVDGAGRPSSFPSPTLEPPESLKDDFKVINLNDDMNDLNIPVKPATEYETEQNNLPLKPQQQPQLQGTPVKAWKDDVTHDDNNARSEAQSESLLSPHLQANTRSRCGTPLLHKARSPSGSLRAARRSSPR